MRRRSLIGMLVFVCLTASPRAVLADMIEVKGKGFMNGTVVSQDEKEVRFEDANKNVTVIPKSEVLFLDTRKDALAAEAHSKPAQPGSDWKQKATDVWGQAKAGARKAQRSAEELKQKAMDVINKPLDRSGADLKTQMANQATEGLVQSMGSMSKNQQKSQKNLRMMTTEYDASKHKGKKSSGSRFGKLD